MKYVKDEDKEIFDSMSKEEIWFKWQSDKRILSTMAKALDHYGMKNWDDIQQVSLMYDDKYPHLKRPEQKPKILYRNEELFGDGLGEEY